jgi:hypothetical protein
MSASISSTEKRSRGRPRTNPVPQHFTMPRDLSEAVDAWIAEQSEPRPARPEAIRRLLAKALGRRAYDGCNDMKFETKWRTFEGEIRSQECESKGEAERCAFARIADGYEDVRVEDDRGNIVVPHEELRRRRTKEYHR